MRLVVAALAGSTVGLTFVSGTGGDRVPEATGRAAAVGARGISTSALSAVVEQYCQACHNDRARTGGLSLASNLPPGSLPTLNPASTALAQGNALLANIGTDALAQLACVTASLCYALAAVWARHWPQP